MLLCMFTLADNKTDTRVCSKQFCILFGIAFNRHFAMQRGAALKLVYSRLDMTVQRETGIVGLYLMYGRQLILTAAAAAVCQ